MELFAICVPRVPIQHYYRSICATDKLFSGDLQFRREYDFMTRNYLKEFNRCAAARKHVNRLTPVFGHRGRVSHRGRW